MPHAVRDARGEIVSLHRERVPGSEWLAADAAELRGFAGPHGPAAAAEPAGAQAEFRQLDADLVRVLEDLVDVLISRQVIRVTDLPAEAQEKLFARKSFRERLPARALRLFEPEPDNGAGNDSGNRSDNPDDNRSDVIATDFGAL